MHRHQRKSNIRFSSSLEVVELSYSSFFEFLFWYSITFQTRDILAGLFRDLLFVLPVASEEFLCWSRGMCLEFSFDAELFLMRTHHEHIPYT